MEVFVRTNVLQTSQIVQSAIAILPALLVCKDSTWTPILNYAKLVLQTVQTVLHRLLVFNAFPII